MGPQITPQETSLLTFSLKRILPSSLAIFITDGDFAFVLCVE